MSVVAGSSVRPSPIIIPQHVARIPISLFPFVTAWPKTSRQRQLDISLFLTCCVKEPVIHPYLDAAPQQTRPIEKGKPHHTPCRISCARPPRAQVPQSEICLVLEDAKTDARRSCKWRHTGTIALGIVAQFTSPRLEHTCHEEYHLQTLRGFEDLPESLMHVR